MAVQKFHSLTLKPSGNNFVCFNFLLWLQMTAGQQFSLISVAFLHEELSN